MEVFTIIGNGILLLGGAITLLLGSFAGSFAAKMLFEGLSHARIEARLNQLEGKFYSGQGLAAKAEKNERLQEAIVKAAAIMKGEEDQNAKNQKLLALATEYPDVAIQLAGKIGLKGLF